MAKRVLPVYIDDAQRDALKSLSKTTKASMAELVRRAIEDLLAGGAKPSNDGAGHLATAVANDTAPPAIEDDNDGDDEPDTFTQANVSTPKVPW